MTTKTAQFTPGPWKAFNSKNGRIFKHWQVDTGTGSVTLDDAAHWEVGNAHLIAAAPAMYAALEQVWEVLGKQMDLVTSAMVEEAIAQAEGKP